MLDTISSTKHSIQRTELVQTENEQRLIHLESEDLWLDERERLAVDFDHALAGLAVCDSCRRLLLAEALNGLNGRHSADCCVCRLVDVDAKRVVVLPFNLVSEAEDFKMCAKPRFPAKLPSGAMELWPEAYEISQLQN